MATMDEFEKAAWIAETRRLFDALVIEVEMVLADTKALRARVLAACVEDEVDPPVDPPVYVPPVIAIAARTTSVKEG